MVKQQVFGRTDRLETVLSCPLTIISTSIYIVPNISVYEVLMSAGRALSFTIILTGVFLLDFNTICNLVNHITLSH
jgi:hypothetical protein